MTSATEITQNLVRCASVTPVDAGAQVYLAGVLKSLGFQCHHLPFENVPNLFARIGTGKPHICFGGHTDVVPTGPEHLWTHPPFGGAIAGGKLYGRGSSDMKGGVAAFAAAAIAYVQKHGTPKGSISLLITGDEEGPAEHGTVKVLEWMKKNGHVPDVAIVGEPTNPSALGQEVKIGRRGSTSGRIVATGKQGHAAYPHLADNPLPRLIKLCDALASFKFDKGTEFFPPTNLEIVSIDVANPAHNVIPARGTADFNVRFNDTWSSKTLEKKIREILDSVKVPYALEMEPCNAESFITKPGAWSELVKKAVIDVTGKTPQYTTNGGTSDARFIVNYCPVVEFGGINATVHQIDENADVDVLENLAKIYTRVIELYFS